MAVGRSLSHFRFQAFTQILKRCTEHYISINIKRLSLLTGLVFFTCLGLAPINPAHAENRLIILVRHAEKADTPANDPQLSPKGEMRATSLITALSRTPLSQLIATQYQRTQQTLAPIAEARHLPVTIVEAAKPIEEHIQLIVEQVHAVRGNTLIAGHSNTVPLIIKALGGPEAQEIGEEDYSQLFLLSLNDGQPASLIATRYGQE
ncbi:MAG: histidine phosphatase family protein [Gammaproteobacteria bacterium]|nr:histidine phosphatase family protein [Gammaproteobacteria bacterium]MBU1476729.1 histidine phosphatase family protein [Gammaproteobacteria bacterium]MBU1999899.1 histidine phosphatase family protein [Gammaproteobacteria bacterium]MBU2133711.1 histidine phosphatase family protein [Gammaproteobacteria bacterium]MBU2187812.1 histidine phosphatase family protein [Gammaproteobacteria bacterium]